MAFDRAALEALAESVGDGAPVEWEAIEAQASAADRPIIRQLRVLESLAHLHRTLPPQGAPVPLPAAKGRSSSAPAIGTWGHLSLLERLGGGSYGEVYRAWDRQLERDVALKVLRGGTPDSSRLLTEARLLARLKHENVVTIHGVDTHDGRVGLWMELVHGATLEQVLASQGPFSASEAAIVGIKLCKALAAIHAAGLVHRDVKAQNVMREDGGRIVLMDLGTSRDVGSGEPAAGVAGTPLYLAPEIFDGGSASTRSDIYSLGVLLYHLVTGEYPVRAATFNGLEQGHAANRVVRLRDARPDLPTAFVTAIDRAIARDPARRYETAGAFEEDLVRSLEAPRVSSPRSMPWWQMGVAAAALVGVGLVAINFLPKSTPPATAATGIRSIAVLPLRNDSGDAGQDYFADGMTDEIISTLGRLDGLNVISRTSTIQFKGMQYNGSSKTLPEIAQALKADAVVEGSVMITAERPGTPRKVRISARLIAAGTDTQLWNQTFETIASDVLELENNVAKAIADGIQLHLSDQQTGSLDEAARDGRPQDFDAFSLVLRGRYYWNLRTKSDLNRSIEYFQQALDRDPKYAAAYSGLADAYLLLGTYGMVPIAQANAQAFTAASRAVALDDTLAEAHASMAWGHDHRLEWEAAEASYQRAIALKPSYARAHHWYAAHLMRLGRFDEATKSIQQAMTLDPLSPSVDTQLGAILFLSRKYDDAIAHLEKTMGTYDTFARGHRLLGEAYAQKRQFDRGLKELSRAVALGDTSAELRAYEGAILALAGRRAEAAKIAQELTDRYRQSQDGGPVAIAVVYAGLNDADRAFEWLNRGWDLKDPWIGYLQVDPWFDNIRQDRRFATLLARAGLTR